VGLMMALRLVFLQETHRGFLLWRRLWPSYLQYVNESSQDTLRLGETSLVDWLVASQESRIRVTYRNEARRKRQAFDLLQEVRLLRSTDQRFGFGLPTLQLRAIVSPRFESFGLLNLALKGLYQRCAIHLCSLLDSTTAPMISVSFMLD